MDRDGNGEVDEDEMTTFLEFIFLQMEQLQQHLRENKKCSYDFLNKPDK